MKKWIWKIATALDLFSTSTMFAIMASSVLIVEKSVIALSILSAFEVVGVISEFLATFLYKRLAPFIKTLMKVDVYSNLVWASVFIIYGCYPNKVIVIFAAVLVIFDKLMLDSLFYFRSLYEGGFEKEELGKWKILSFRARMIGRFIGVGLAGYLWIYSNKVANLHMYAIATLFLTGGLLKLVRLQFLPEDY